MVLAHRKGNEVFINKNPRKPDFRLLTNDEIDEASEKEWKEQNHTHEDPKKNNSLQNLTGPKTKEGKKRALQNLRPAASKTDADLAKTKHAGYLRELLNEDERTFYERRKEEYIKDFDLNESSDVALLNMCLMEEVIYRRLMLYQAENPSKSIDKPLNECQKRLRESLKSLGMTREQRQGQKVSVTHSISDLAERVMHELEYDTEKLILMEEEEKELMRKKKDRDQDNIVDAEFYEDINDDDVDSD